MKSPEKPHRLLVELSPELSRRLRQEAERRSTIARRATLAAVIRELIAEHCGTDDVRSLTA